MSASTEMCVGVDEREAWYHSLAKMGTTKLLRYVWFFSQSLPTLALGLSARSLGVCSDGSQQKLFITRSSLRRDRAKICGHPKGKSLNHLNILFNIFVDVVIVLLHVMCCSTTWTTCIYRVQKSPSRTLFLPRDSLLEIVCRVLCLGQALLISVSWLGNNA